MPNLLPKSLHLLVVEDDPDNLAQMLDWLTPRGATLLQARHAEQALKILRSKPVDAVISDWQLPGLSGLELIRSLRDSDFKGPLLICTGLMLDAEHLQQAFEAGASDYLRKPLNVVEFNARLDKSLQLFAQQAALEQLNHSQTELMNLMNDQLGTGLQRLLQWQELEMGASGADYQHERYATTRQMQQRFHQLVSWSRYRFSSMPSASQHFEVRQLFKSVQQRFAASDRLQISGGTGAYLCSDSERLQRVLIQLVDNALTHTSGGVMLKLSTQDKRLRLAVLDEGENLSEGDLARLESGQVFGLGLRICHDLLSLLGTRLICQKRRGAVGSQFYFELPATPAP
ncbi:MAG: hybrid sensor histidine kinase/response regulator [Candidatus Sericytochromatia bacterium]